MSTTRKKESALSLPYVRRLRFFMWSLGLWPEEALGKPKSIPNRFMKKSSLIICAFCNFGGINYLYRFSNNIPFTLFVQCIINTILSGVTTSRSAMINFKNFGTVVARFFLSFHLINFKHRGKHYAKMYETINKWSYYFSAYATATMLTATILFNISPIYPNYKNGAFTGDFKENETYKFSIYLIYPGYDQNKWFITSTLMNLVFSYECGVLVCGIDLLLALMVFQIIGHVFILRNNLKEFPKPKKQNMVRVMNAESKFELVVSEMFDEEENIIVHQRLVECIEHHKFIVSFTQNVSDFFGPMLAATYLSHLINCCLLLLMCTKGDAGLIISFVPLTVNIFGELIQISVIFEIVGTVSEKLPDSVYGTPWASMNVKNRRTICLFLQRVQTPIQVMALKTIPVGVTTMTKILKTTFSYYTFLRSIES